MIPAHELAALQAASQDALDTPCMLQRKSPTKSSIGGQVDNFATISTTTCNLSQPTAQQMQNYDYLIGALSAWQVRFPIGTDVRNDDQVLVGGLTLRVQVVLGPHSYPVCVHVLASEVR